MPIVTMTVNGEVRSAEVEGRTLLAQFLREHLRLTGTHVECDTNQYGACTVQVDGEAIKFCSTLALACDGANLVTIEGLAIDGIQVDSEGLNSDIRGNAEYRAHAVIVMAKRTVEVAVSR